MPVYTYFLNPFFKPHQGLDLQFPLLTFKFKLYSNPLLLNLIYYTILGKLTAVLF